MTEDEWNSCGEPSVMLGFLRNTGKVADRKLRLFLVACCRTVWHLLHKRTRKAVTVMEDFIDGRTTVQRWEQARHAIWSNTYRWLTTPQNDREATDHAAEAVTRCVSSDHDYAEACLRAVIAARVAEDGERSRSAMGVALARLLTDLFGSLPFRPVPINESWLRWSDGTVVKIAQAIYDERRFEDLPILADALEESGCSDAEILAHLRGPGPHVKGCWAIDLLLQKDQGEAP